MTSPFSCVRLSVGYALSMSTSQLALQLAVVFVWARTIIEIPQDGVELLSPIHSPYTPTFTMEHNLAQYRAQLLLSRFYGANPDFLQGIGWQPEITGHVLVDKRSHWQETLVIAVVGRVLDQQLHCGPSGNYINPMYGSLAKAKFQLQLRKPYGTPFETDFDTVLNNLGKLQAEIASTPDWHNLVITDGHDKNLRFARNVFEKRENIIPTPDEDMDNDRAESEVEGMDVVDSETENWPLSSNLREELDKIKYEYCALPLAVYIGNNFVEPHDVNEAIRGALVELHFELHHSCDLMRGQSGQDFFNASIEQIIVLQPGQPRRTSPYKRRNVRDGPIRLNPTLALLMQESGSSSQQQQGTSNSHQTSSEQAEASSAEQTPSTSTTQAAGDMDHETADGEDDIVVTEDDTSVSGIKGKGKAKCT